MKRVILVGDGMADDPQPALGGKTPLEAAATPNMDRIAARGRVGRVLTVPSGFPPGTTWPTYRSWGTTPRPITRDGGRIEAASIGAALDPDDTAFRCNIVTLGDGLMADYSAGHHDRGIAPDDRGDPGRLGTDRVRFVPGISYRHLLIIRDFPAGLDCTPPHDISGRNGPPTCRRARAELILDLMEKARPVLAANAANRKRATPATDIWPWGQGRAMRPPTLDRRFGLKGSVISAVDLVRGLGVLAGLAVRPVEGATGYLGTNYAGKVAAAEKPWPARISFISMSKRPTKPATRASSRRKSRPSRNSTGTSSAEILAWAESDGVRILVAPDHATKLATKTHAADPVPYAVCGPGVARDGGSVYHERAAESAPSRRPSGCLSASSAEP